MKHLTEDDIQKTRTLLYLFGIAAESGELDDQTVVDATIAISEYMHDRAEENARTEAKIEARAVPQ